ncbi:MAG: VOC family protein [Candidatus Dormibacteraeota bacterium]|nr:VOC family protein [Candidatus Dormibacteraeota bacterium]MBV9525407.1 VOC family protein [Candidatus Dormibacteraeota bacterium]
MLNEAVVHATLPCIDFDRAKAFYAEKLGLSPAEEQPAGAFYDAAGGTRFFLFPSSGAASGSHTQMGFRVNDIEATVRELRGRGVEFESYDFPGFDKETCIASIGGAKSAWFKDSEGNLLGVVQLS